MTTIVQASLAGQAAGTLLENYVPQTADVNATFSRAARTSSSALQFTPASRVRATVSSDTFYFAGPALATGQDLITISADLYYAGQTALDGAGLVIGDNNDGTNFLDVLTWQGSAVSNSLHITSHVNSAGGGDIATPAYAMAVGSTYTLTVKVNGASGSYTIDVSIGLKGQAPTTLVTGLAVPGLVMSGRRIGVRNYPTGAGVDTSGIHIANLLATAADVGSPPPPAPPPSAAPDFSVATVPASMVLSQGQSLSLAVSLAAVGGYTGTDTLLAIGLPSGVTASFSRATIADGVGTATMTLAVAGNATTGAFSLSVQATDGTITRSAPVALQVNPPSGVVYPVAANVLDTDLVTITRNGTTEQVAASVLKAYLA